MTIEKGRLWGQEIVVPLTTRDVDSDWQLAQGSPNQIHILTAGDLFDALGKPSIPLVGQTRTVVRIDALVCTITHEAVSHRVIAASTIEIGHWFSWGRKNRYIVVSNGGIMKGRNIAPRAHPNDGVAHVMAMEEEISWRNKRSAWQRAKTGTHIPHPYIGVTQGQFFSFSKVRKREKLTIDGQIIPVWQNIEIKVIADNWQVIV